MSGKRGYSWAYLLLLLAMNVYICREAFHTESSGQWNSMHGQWMELARLGGSYGLSTRWWRYCFLGTPTEYVYAPLVPVLTSVLSHATHSSIPLAFNVLSGAVYCLGPVTLYLVIWRWQRASFRGFVAGLIYSLLAPTEWIIPDTPIHWASGLAARRMYLLFVWDDLPHLTTLALLPVAAWLLCRALESARTREFVWPVLVMAAMMLDSMFGVVLSLFMLFTVPLVLRPLRLTLFARASAAGVCAYLLICPWVPPSLLRIVRFNEAHNGEGDSPLHSIEAFAIAALAMAAVWLFTTRWVKSVPLRWLALFACPAILIPVTASLQGPHFVPQPGRYKAEMELAIAWLIPFCLTPIVKRIPRPVSAVLLVALAAGALWQVASFRKFAIGVLAPVDSHASIEYRASHWLGAHLPGQRVLMGGSLSRGLNVFTDSPQLDGPYTTDANPMVEVAWFTIKTGQNAGAADAAYSIVWLQAMGVQAIGVPGPHSPEFWKPFVNPRKFDGVLPVLWREDDTTIYRVPQPTTSLAHAVRPDQLVQHPPIHGLDTKELERYVAAINDPAAPPATFEWRGVNHARVRSHLRPGDVLSAQIDYHPGWHAHVNGSERAVRKDGIGMITIEPQCAGDCEIALDFDGGTEAKFTCVLNVFALLVLCACLFARRRIPVT